jgi:hypothetical protein
MVPADSGHNRQRIHHREQNLGSRREDLQLIGLAAMNFLGAEGFQLDDGFTEDG